MGEFSFTFATMKLRNELGYGQENKGKNACSRVFISMVPSEGSVFNANTSAVGGGTLKSKVQ